MILFIWNSRKCKLIYRSGKHITGCLGTGGGMNYKGLWGNFWSQCICSLMVMMLSQVCTYIKTHQIVYFIVCNLLNVNYTSIMMKNPLEHKIIYFLLPDYTLLTSSALFVNSLFSSGFLSPFPYFSSMSI